MSCQQFPNIENDKRQVYLKNLFKSDGYNAILTSELDYANVEIAEYCETTSPIYVLLPLPVSNKLLSLLKNRLTQNHFVLGGNIPTEFTAFFSLKNIPYIDYMKDDIIKIENAVATAEGAICNAIMSSEINIHGSNILIIGFGKCGEILADKLIGLKGTVYVKTRKETSLAKAITMGCYEHCEYKKYDFIFNTAPAMVLSPDIIEKLNRDVVIIDIASKPGGCDFNYCKEKGITAKLCPGLPGKISPKTSAQIIYKQLRKRKDALSWKTVKQKNSS